MGKFITTQAVHLHMLYQICDPKFIQLLSFSTTITIQYNSFKQNHELIIHFTFILNTHESIIETKRKKISSGENFFI